MVQNLYECSRNTLDITGKDYLLEQLSIKRGNNLEIIPQSEAIFKPSSAVKL